MFFANLRAGRAPLAVLVTAVITLTLAACAADQPVTAPSAHPNEPVVAEQDIPTLATDSTLITFSPEREGKIFSNGYVGVTGTIVCSRDLGEVFTVVVKLQQNQRDGDLVASSQYGLTCLSQGQAAVFYIAPVTGGPFFKRGKAIATFEIVGGAPAVIRSTESRSVRLVEVK